MALRNLAPPRTDVAIWRGDGFPFDVVVTNSDTGAAYPLTGHTIWCTFKRQLSDLDSAAVWQGTASGGAITITGNTARVVVPGSAFVLLTEPTTLYFDVQIQAPGGQPQTVVWGTALIQLDVTRATT